MTRAGLLVVVVCGLWLWAALPAAGQPPDAGDKGTSNASDQGTSRTTDEESSGTTRQETPSTEQETSPSPEKTPSPPQETPSGPPAPPTGLEGSTEGRRVSLTWRPSSGPGIAGYIVERSDGGGFTEVGRSVEPAYSETVKPGAYTYRVRAVGTGSASGENVSEPSSPIGLSVAGAEGSSKAQQPQRPRKKSQEPVLGEPGVGLTGLISASGGSARLSGLPPGASAPAASGRGRAEVRRLVSQEGGYKQRLPYADAPDATGLRGNKLTAEPRSEPVPPDQLGWIAAGFLLVTTAGLIKLAVKLSDAGLLTWRTRDNFSEGLPGAQ